MSRSQSDIYRKWSKQIRGQLVKRLDGNWEKVVAIQGLAVLKSGRVLYVITAEGHKFWCEKDLNGRLHEVTNEKAADAYVAGVIDDSKRAGT